mgnify:CR=1 FL=1
MSLTKSELAKYMDHTLLKADATAEQIDRCLLYTSPSPRDRG